MNVVARVSPLRVPGGWVEREVKRREPGNEVDCILGFARVLTGSYRLMSRRLVRESQVSATHYLQVMSLFLLKGSIFGCC